MAVYTIALLNITDRERYGEYSRGLGEIFRKHSGKMLSVEEAPTVIEGEWPHTRTVLIEFPDADAFNEWYHSPKYQELVKHRHAASTGSVVLIKSFTPPSAPPAE